MYWISFFILIFIIFIFKFGKKQKFDFLETYWLFYFLLFWISILIPFELKYKILILIIIFFNSRLKLIISFFSSFLTLFFKQNKFQSLRSLSCNLFQQSFNFEKEIIVLNYPSNYIEYFIPPLFGNKVCLLIFEGGYTIVKYIWGEKYLIPISKKSFQKTQEKIKEKIKENFVVCAYLKKIILKEKQKIQFLIFVQEFLKLLKIFQYH